MLEPRPLSEACSWLCSTADGLTSMSMGVLSRAALSRTNLGTGNTSGSLRMLAPVAEAAPVTSKLLVKVLQQVGDTTNTGVLGEQQLEGSQC